MPPLDPCCATSATASGSSHKLDVVGDDFEFGALLSGSFVIPAIHVQASLNEEGLSFSGILVRYLSCASPEGDINKSGFFDTLTSVTCANSIDGKADVSNGSALGGIAKLDITGYITHEHYFIKIGHDLKATLLRWWTAIVNYSLLPEYQSMNDLTEQQA